MIYKNIKIIKKPISEDTDNVYLVFENEDGSGHFKHIGFVESKNEAEL